MPKSVAYQAGAIIYFIADKASGIFILKQGKVELTYQDILTGSEVREPIKTGEFFGVQATLAGSSYSETAMATSDSQVVQFPVAEFEALISSNNRLMMKMLQVFSNQLRRIHKQVQSHLSHDNVNISQEAGLFAVGEYYINDSQYAQAAHAFCQYLKYWPTGTYAPQAKLKADEAKSALEQSANSQELTSKKYASYSGLSFKDVETQYNLRQHKDAMKGYMALLESGRDQERIPYIKFRVGCCLYYLERYDEAIKHLSTILRQYPQHSHLGEAVSYIGLSYGALDQETKAQGFYRKACQVLPKESNLYRQMMVKARGFGNNQ